MDQEDGRLIWLSGKEKWLGDSGMTFHNFLADVAQLVEQSLRKGKVVGSIPTIGSSYFFTVQRAI